MHSDVVTRMILGLLLSSAIGAAAWRRASLTGSGALGAGTTFSSVGWSWKTPGKADGCFWVSGTVTNKDKPASVITYDVCCQ